MANFPAILANFPVSLVNFPALLVKFPALSAIFRALSASSPPLSAQFSALLASFPSLSVHFPARLANYSALSPKVSATPSSATASLWRIVHGIDASDEDTACPPVSKDFESRLVTKRGAKKRMGILDYWQHGAGLRRCAPQGMIGQQPVRHQAQRACHLRRRAFAMPALRPCLITCMITKARVQG